MSPGRILHVFAALAFSAVIGAACATRPDQIVLRATVAYGGAVKAAVAYELLPRCTTATPAGMLCSQSNVVDLLRQADNVAKASIDAAQKTVLTPGVDADAATFAAVSAINAANAFASIVGAPTE